jgi:hypothetical protein
MDLREIGYESEKWAELWFGFSSISSVEPSGDSDDCDNVTVFLVHGTSPKV